RLVTARHGAELLDRKQRILADDLERLQLRAARTEQAWIAAAREAETWRARAAALDGRQLIASAAPLEPAVVRLEWGSEMGVTYPEDALCDVPATHAIGASSALALAADAARTALAAGVRHAAAERAVRLVAAELETTRTRLRAVERRWVPRLEAELDTIRRQLQEQELQETLRLRWAAEALSEARADAAPGTRDHVRADDHGRTEPP
ncbi:MAG TPA: V-type ATP synthase subunit D, partial [Propionibacteriaceae bacterium]|nr:V-type ATP synthase subunit D [Propionibacteriaceae bacterium]